MDKGWGAEKVRIFYHDCREKGLLWVLAHWADGSGKDIYPSYRYLSTCTGQSERTIRRQIRELVMRGDLVSWCDLKRSRDSNYYMIPLCAETVSELEQRTGISRSQLRLPLVVELRRVQPIQNDVDRAEHLAKIGVKKRPTPTATVTLGVGHCGPVSEEADILEKGVSKKFLKEKGKGIHQLKKADDPDARVAISQSFEAVMADLVAKLAAPEARIRNPALIARSEQHQRDLAMVRAEIVALK